MKAIKFMNINMKNSINVINKLNKLAVSVLLLFCAYVNPLFAQSLASPPATSSVDEDADIECLQMQAAIRQTNKNRQIIQHLNAIQTARNAYCLGDDSMKAGAQMTTAVLKAWSADILGQVVPATETLRFDQRQLQRLATFKEDLKRMQTYINTTQEDWLPTLLDLLSTQNNQLDSVQFSRQLQPIFHGYLDDAEAGQLPQVVKRVALGNFLSQLDQGLNLSNTSDRAVARGGGESAQARLMRTRGAALVSSALQDSPNSVNTPMRFHYDSTKLNERGQQEYQTMLDVLTANTTQSILLIGHASPRGSAAYNCELSKRRVLAIKQKLVTQAGIPATRIRVAWAGEHIPLDFGQANAFLQDRDIVVSPLNNPNSPNGSNNNGNDNNDNNDDPMRRRVEIEINGELLRQRYAGKFCR